MLRFAIIVTLLCVLLVRPTTPQDFSLILISTTGQDVNVLILECRNKETNQGEPSAFFWLNETSLFDIMPSFQINRVSSGTQILFVITGDLEGVYTCGTQTNPNNRRESDSLYFVGKLQIILCCLMISFCSISICKRCIECANCLSCWVWN